MLGCNVGVWGWGWRLARTKSSLAGSAMRWTGRHQRTSHHCVGGPPLTRSLRGPMRITGSVNGRGGDCLHQAGGLQAWRGAVASGLPHTLTAWLGALVLMVEGAEACCAQRPSLHLVAPVPGVGRRLVRLEASDGAATARVRVRRCCPLSGKHFEVGLRFPTFIWCMHRLALTSTRPHVHAAPASESQRFVT